MIRMFKSDEDKLMFMYMSKSDALKLIESLTKQIIAQDPNSGRLESRMDNGWEFTISVDPDHSDEIVELYERTTPPLNLHHSPGKRKRLANLIYSKDFCKNKRSNF